MTDAERIAELEAQLAFQERAIEKLQEAMLEQQKRLENDLTKIRNRQAPEQAKTKPKGQNTGQKSNP